MTPQPTHTTSTRTNLSHDINPLIGRAPHLDAIAQAFESGRRLITLTGTGGAGKTHLAAHVAHDVLSRGHQEVWFCDLTGAQNGADIVHIVKHSIALPNGANHSLQELVDRLAIALGERGPVLLVLDNFEHLVPFAAETIGRWLSVTRDVAFLVTSRQRLHLPDEHVIDVGPLEEADAIALFVSRARGIDASFSPDPTILPGIRTIIRRLDALPLAIHMAAPWVQTLGVDDLAAELERSPDILTLDDPRAPARHARLDATIRWSWDQLADHEKTMLLHISRLFFGRFSLQTAEAVLGRDEHAPPVLATLRNLVERSVLRTIRGDPWPDSVLFGSFQTVALLVDTFTAPDAPDTFATSARRFVDLAITEVRRLRSARFAEALGWLERHRADLAHLIATHRKSDPDLCAGAALVLQRLAGRIGPIEAAAEYATMAIAYAREANQTAICADALRGRAEAAWIERRFEDAVAALDEATDLLADIDYPGLRGETLLLRAHVARDMRQHDLAASCCDQALESFAAAGDTHGQALTLLVRATGPDMDAANDKARRSLEKAATTASRHADSLVSGHINSALATWYTNRGDMPNAIAHHRAALSDFSNAGELGQRIRVMGFLGVALFDTGGRTEGRQLIDEALEEARRLGVGTVAATVPDPASSLDAESLLRMESVAKLLSASGDYVADGVTAGHLAALLLRRGDVAAARRAYQLGLEHMLTNPDRGRPAIHFQGLAASLDLAAGRFDDAIAGYARALGWIEGWEGMAGKAAGTLIELCLDLARRQQVPAQARQDRVVMQLVNMMDMASRLSPLVATGVQSLRLALLPPDEATPPTDQSLRIGPDALWFEFNAEDRVDLSRSGPIRGMLQALAQRATGDRRPMTIAELFEAGWPGENIRPAPAANRVHATLSRLRTLGLKSVVVRTRAGWRIEPAITVLLTTE